MDHQSKNDFNENDIEDKQKSNHGTEPSKSRSIKTTHLLRAAALKISASIPPGDIEIRFRECCIFSL